MGTALLETIPLLVIFVILLGFAMGLFGIVHTAVLHSIAARTYSFESFRNRTNLQYFREDGSGLILGDVVEFLEEGCAVSSIIQHESDPRNLFVATVRPVAYGNAVAQGDSSEPTNNLLNIYSSMPVRNT